MRRREAHLCRKRRNHSWKSVDEFYSLYIWAATILGGEEGKCGVLAGRRGVGAPGAVPTLVVVSAAGRGRKDMARNHGGVTRPQNRVRARKVEASVVTDLVIAGRAAERRLIRSLDHAVGTRGAVVGWWAAQWRFVVGTHRDAEGLADRRGTGVSHRGGEAEGS